MKTLSPNTTRVVVSLAPIGLIVWAVGCGGLLGFDEVSFGDGGAAGATVGGGAGVGGPGGAGQAGSSEAGVGGSFQAGSGGSSQAGSGGSSQAGAGGSAQGGSGQAGTGGSAQGGTGGSSQAGTGGSAQGGTGGAPDPCANITCQAHEHCEPANQQCVCDPGFVSNNGSCEPTLPGDPTNHTEQQVCDAWKKGHSLTDPNPWSAGADTCDPGTLARAGIDDTLARINMFRWMLGLGPVSDSESQNETDQYCAVVAAYNPPGVVPNPHHPPTTAKCYTTQGAQGAGSSNIAWGSGNPANAIDQFIQDNGNFSTFGHRRWIFNAPLGPVGIGYYGGGGPYGNAECLGVFAQSGGGPYPDWISFPPPGFAPLSIVKWVWTFHHKKSVSNAAMTVTRKSDSADLKMKKMSLAGGYGPSYQAVAFQIDGWTPKAGETYLVHVEGIDGGPIDYEVKPTSCN